MHLRTSNDTRAGNQDHIDEIRPQTVLYFSSSTPERRKTMEEYKILPKDKTDKTWLPLNTQPLTDKTDKTWLPLNTQPLTDKTDKTWLPLDTQPLTDKTDKTWLPLNTQPLTDKTDKTWLPLNTRPLTATS